jgi:chromosome segregation ATPase
LKASILEGSRFSRPTKAAITNCQTYEHIKEVIKRLGKTNNELKMKNTELENLKEISEKKSKALENENKILRNKIAEYEEKEEKDKLLLTEHEKLLKENNVMKLDLQSKTKEISYLSNELGGLKYKSSVFDEVDKKCMNLEQSLSPMKTDLKSKNTEIQKLQTIVKAQSTTIYNLRSQHSVLKEDLRKMQLDILKSTFNFYF